MPAIGDKLLLV